MGQRGEYIPPNAPLSEGYWQALLRDGEGGRAAPTAEPAEVWKKEMPGAGTEPEQAPSSIDIQDPWEEARQWMDTGDAMELPVVDCNRGGVLVAWNGLRGFVPASHLLELGPVEGEKERQEALQDYIGRRLSLQIIELDQDEERLILSERATQIDGEPNEEILQELHPGDICQGRVTSLCSFGAFIDLGGFEGLVHISEISWGRVGHPQELLEQGQVVNVYVLSVEPERDRVGLSIKRLRPNPWQSAEERYTVGQVLEGTVSHLVDFGAFVQIEEGLEGLIHVSEMGEGESCAPQDVLTEGDRVSVTVLSIDGARHRMGLSLEQRLATAGEAQIDESPPGRRGVR